MIDPSEQRRDGIAVIDKPAGWTSHDVVAKVRGILRNKKVGHSGTLDPDATGVLLLGIGRATRLLRYLTPLPKTYECEVVLGVETSTLDAAGEVVATHDMSGVTIDDVRRAALAFEGDILQVPPMVSAIQVDGVRLHEMARRGEEIEREPRPVTIHWLQIDPLDRDPSGSDITAFRLAVTCSSGTYVRSLAADIGTALGGGAHLRDLRRTAIGSFTLDVATSIEEVTVRPMTEAIRDQEQVVVTAAVATDVRHGKVLDGDVLGVSGDGPWAVLDPDGALLAVYQAHREHTVKPTVVLADPLPAADPDTPTPHDPDLTPNL